MTLRAALAAADPRFMAHVDVTDTCWLWQGYRNEKGYGATTREYRKWTAHGWAWHLAGRELPKGMHLDHLCRVRACVNPDHLEVVTPRENLERSPVSAMNRVECPHGHPYTGDNLAIVKDGGIPTRRCKECKNAAARRKRLWARFLVMSSDPAFRLALTEAVAEALHEAHVPPWFYGHRSDDLTYAAAIVARMLEGRSD